jgi:iron complex transport system substrate-binding protein
MGQHSLLNRTSLAALPASLALVLLCLSGCRSGQLTSAAGSEPPPRAPAAQASSPGTFPVTIQEDLGRQVTIPKRPERIVSLTPANTELLFALGLGDRVVGVTSYCDYPPEARSREIVGGFTDPSLEKIVALRPDLVLVSRGNPREFIGKLEELGAAVVALDPETLAGVCRSFTLAGQVTGASAEAAVLLRQWDQRRQAVQQALATHPEEKPRALVIVSLEGLWVAGPDNYLDDLLTLAGGQNVAAEAPTPWPEYSLEKIVVADPQVILLSADHRGSAPSGAIAPERLAQFRSEPAWARVSAVREGRVYEISTDILMRPGPRLMDCLEAMARALHPEAFPPESTP